MQLSVSLGLSLLVAVALIKVSIYFDFREALALSLPVLPSLFPLFYKVLARNPVVPESAPTSLSVRRGFLRRQLWPGFWEMRFLRAVAVGVAVGVLTKYAMEGFFLYGLYRRSGQPFEVVFGGGGDSLIGCFLRGDLLIARASGLLPLLVAELLVVAAVGGLWVGASASRSPVVEAMCVGTILALAATLTNFAVLYRWIGSLAEPAAPLLDPRVRDALPLAGPVLTVFLFGAFALAGQLWRREHGSHAAVRSRTARSLRTA
jgi:hypothetical protein